MESIPNNIDTDSKNHQELEATEKVRPIMTSIGTFETYDELKEKYPDFPNIDTDLGIVESTNIDWYGNSKKLEQSGFLNAGEHTYVISKIDETNKISKEFGGCTGIVSSGKEMDSGHYISFMTHQDLPGSTEEEKVQFAKHLNQRFSELKDRCTPDSIDVIIIGGEQTNRHSKEYTDGIKFLTEEIKKDTGLDPVIIGPKIHGVYDNAYYDNKNRRLYLVRSDETTNNIILKGSEIDEKSKYWKD